MFISTNKNSSNFFFYYFLFSNRCLSLTGLRIERTPSPHLHSFKLVTVGRSFDCTAPFFVWRNISLAFLKYVWAQAGKTGAAEGEAEGGPRPRQDQGVRGKQDVRGFFSSLSLLFSYFSSFSFFFPCITFYFFLFFPLLCLPVCSYLFFSLSSSSFVLSSYTEYCSKTADPFIHNGLVDVGANPFTKSTRSGGCTIL